MQSAVRGDSGNERRVGTHGKLQDVGNVLECAARMARDQIPDHGSAAGLRIVDDEEGSLGRHCRDSWVGPMEQAGPVSDGHGDRRDPRRDDPQQRAGRDDAEEHRSDRRGDQRTARRECSQPDEDPGHSTASERTVCSVAG